MSPEVLLGSPASCASDVFALAVTLNELATGMVPYSDCTRDNPLAHTVLEMGYGRQELAAAVAAEGLRPTLHPGTPPALAALLQACWERQPEARPAAAAVAEQLAALAAEAAQAAAGAAPAGASPPPTVLTPAPAAGRLLPSPQRPLWHGGAPDDAAGDAEMLDAEAAEADFAGGSPSSSCAAGLGGGSPTAVASPASSSPSSSATGTLPCWLAASPQQQQSAAAQQGVAQQQAQQQQVQVGTFLTPGRRDAMEDAVVVLHDVCAAAGTPGCTALGVFDGHRGAAAADYLTANLQRHLVQQLGSSGSAAAALAGTLADADVAFRAEQDAAWAARLARMGVAAAGSRPAPGATATLLLLYPAAAAGQGMQQQHVLAVANLGDSRAVLCRDGEVGSCCTVTVVGCGSVLASRTFTRCDGARDASLLPY